MSDSIAVIKKANLFETLTDHECRKIAELGKPKHLIAGESLIKESAVGTTMYLILSGRVDVSVSIPGGGSNETIATLKDGDVVGELILLGRERRSAHVFAKDDVEAIEWQRDDLLKLFEEDKEIGYKVMRQLGRLLSDRLVSTNLVLRNILTVPRTVLM